MYRIMGNNVNMLQVVDVSDFRCEGSCGLFVWSC